MPEKAAKYAKDDHGDEDRRDQLRVRAEAARKCVRNIQHHPVLSSGWLQLADSLHQLAHLSQLDGMMPVDSKVNDTLGRDKEAEGTLWDQESQENAIRVLVEEAKVNLCLRIMNDYKQWHYDTARRQESIKEAIKTMDLNESQLERKCIQFEESLGLLLCRAFQHVETLQLTDVPLLIEHCSLVLQYCAKLKLQAPTNVKTQETVVLYYFSSLCTHAEKLNNNELLAKVQEYGLLHQVVRQILDHHAAYPAEVVGTVCDGLSALADNEDFGTNWKDFFKGPEAVAEHEAFLELDTKVVQPMLAAGQKQKGEIRALTDFFNKLKRSKP